MDIKRLDSLDSDFQLQLDKLLAWDSTSDEAVFKTVSEILKSVKNQGDSAVLDFSLRFDGLKAKNLAELEMPLDRLREAYDGIEPRDREALEQAAARIRAYAEHQKLESWEYTEADGTLLGQQITPLDRVGLYVPGGKAAYPSSVLMNAIPAVVAGVQELIMVVPHVAGVTRVFTIGGAQAVAALAYGTETIPAVDKIVGPGNIYVATAKRMVFGIVGIDMVAGPSEILVICDGKTDPDWIAMDLFSQAEHDEDAQADRGYATQGNHRPVDERPGGISQGQRSGRCGCGGKLYCTRTPGALSRQCATAGEINSSCRCDISWTLYRRSTG
jgi:histidinol dehydrogenase